MSADAEWLKWILGIVLATISAAILGLWKYISAEVKDLRNKLDEKVDASTLTAGHGDDQIWEELKAIRNEAAHHERNDAQVHMKFSGDIAKLASREDLDRALDRQTDRILGLLGKDKQ